MLLNKGRISRLRYNLGHAISMIRYEKGKYRLLILLRLTQFFFLRIAFLFLSKDMKYKFHQYRRSLIQKYFLRHPVDVLKSQEERLKVCITYRCNANCKFCYAHGLAKEFPQDMSFTDFTHLLEQAKNLGWEGIHFYGGEPTIHPQFEQMLFACEREKMSVFLSTNALFDLKTLRLILLNPFMRRITITYPQYELSKEKRRQYMKILSFLHMDKVLKKKWPVTIITYLISAEDESYWKELLDFLCFNRSLVLGLTLLIPGFSQEAPSEKLFQEEMREYARKTLEIVRVCAEKNVHFYFFRPLPLCLFSPEELRYLDGVGRFLFYTRCPLGYRGDYSFQLTVNPDLSLYPCTAVFVKGPRFDSFNSKEEISDYYRQHLKELLKRPSTNRCIECQWYKNFLAKMGTDKERLSDKGICQGGCFDFRTGAAGICKE